MDDSTPCRDIVDDVLQVWNVHSVLNVLHSLVDKSCINAQLKVYSESGQ